ncbi:MGMT family protein [Alicyclobacillus ferrooxydans]|uniref:Methylated-DNA-[protein]-cysteine S-methyltransferase DNA binding domain-containing protein n=1 Tax=Alicyclobacillus ferrooxydans TaxID=471514 RepID=A0A0P9D0V7_9BACL|nr:MGMT family protein [Alicyclobacillus ferrooxydans]KPV43129.1 hypothetical protein AN477_14230 [Alicyclobacillus ferrooxydans]
MEAFTQRVIEIVGSIPEGRVMTYGQVARNAGSPRAARQVVRILHSMSKKYKLPWHRVVNAKGEISIQDDASYEMQILLLQTEGIEMAERGQLDLIRYQVKAQDRAPKT